MVRLVLTVILIGLLTACTTSVLAPTSYLVQKAIALQLQQTQEQLSQQLDLDFQGFEINRLSITKEKPLIIQNLPTYRVQGNYNLIFKLPENQVKQEKKPFEVYLQIQKEGKTWRLLIPQTTDKDTKPTSWRTYLIE